jgi:hypothetical protein
MSSRKKTAPAPSIAERAFGETIASCARRWKERWDREPTMNELVRVLEIALAANPDRYVSDVATVLAMNEPKAKPTAPIDADAFEVQFRDTSPFGSPVAELYLRSQGLAKPGYGEVQAYLEVVGDALVVDVQFAEHRAVPRFDQACALIRERVLHRYIGNRDLPVARVVLRPMEGLSDPVILAWPPAD